MTILTSLLLASQSLYQVSAFESLRTGRYDGDYPVASLPRHGSFGLGTFNALDGEMVVLDGAVYRIDGFGDAAPAKADAKTPFAFVVPFHYGQTMEVGRRLDAKALQALVDRLVPNQDICVAIRVVGRFSGLRARSFAPQQKPYLPFAQIQDRQSLFSYGSAEGTFVGFRLPKSVAKGNVNVPGYHFHFLSSDRKRGGHVLGYTIDSGRIQIMRLAGIASSRL